MDISQIGLKIEKCSASDQNPLIWKSIARYNCPCFFYFLSWLPKCWKTDRRIMTSKIFQWKCQHEIGFYNIQSTTFSRPIWMLISLILEHYTVHILKTNMKVDFRTCKVCSQLSRAIWKLISEHTNYILKSNMKVDFRTYNLVHIFKTNMKLIFRTYKLSILKTKIWKLILEYTKYHILKFNMNADFRMYEVSHSLDQH